MDNSRGAQTLGNLKSKQERLLKLAIVVAAEGVSLIPSAFASEWVPFVDGSEVSKGELSSMPSRIRI